MALVPTDDSIVDGFGGRLPGIFTDGPAVPIPPTIPDGGIGDVVQDRVLNGTPFPFPDPTPDNSYLTYECWIWLETESGVVAVRPLPTRPPFTVNQLLTGNPFISNTGLIENFIDVINDVIGKMPPNVPLGPNGPSGPNGSAGPAALFQQRTAPLTYVFLRGHAVRYGFPVPIPALTDYCGVAPVLSCRLDRGEGYGHGIKRAANQKPIYLATWNLRYLLPGGMQPFFFPPAIPNPMLDSSSQ